MFLKQFPEDVKLGVMVETAFILLQSILMRAQEIIDSHTEKVCADDLQAMTSLVACLGKAKRDAAKVKKRMVN